MVPKAVVAEHQPIVAHALGDATFGVVPQLGEALTNSVAEGYLVQIVERNMVLCRNPLGGGLRVIILEPAIGVGDNGTEVVVRYGVLLRCGVWEHADFHSTIASCQREAHYTEHKRVAKRGCGFHCEWV